MALTTAQLDLYTEILTSQVLASDIHELLKKYKEDNKGAIKLSGAKNELIANLLEVVNTGIINIIDVQTLIKDSEEYGDQHIFLFKPKSSDIVPFYNNGVSLRDSIVSKAVQSQFPKFIANPTDVEWSDFRIPYRGITNSWMLKLYDKRTREVKEDDTFDSSLGKRFITYRQEEFRLVHILTWNGNSELEMKLTRTSFDSYRGLSNSKSIIKNAVHANGRGIALDRDFLEIDLRRNIHNLIVNSDSNTAVYKLINAIFVDSENGVATIKSGDDNGTTDLLSEDSRKDAVDAYINGDGYAKSVAIRLLSSGSNNALSQDINIILGRDNINHIVIPAKIKPQEYRYVRRKIAEFD